MHDLFISYSTTDTLVADAAKHFLESKGVRCWKAPECVAPGEIWEEAITTAIKNTHGMLIIWSSNSQDSKQVTRELSLAAANERIIIPLRIEQVEPAGAFAYYLTNTHWIDALSPSIEEDLERVTAQVVSILAVINKSTQSQTDSSSDGSASESCAKEKLSSAAEARHHDHQPVSEQDQQPASSNKIANSSQRIHHQEKNDGEWDYVRILSILFAAALMVGALSIFRGILHGFWYVFRKGLGF